MILQKISIVLSAITLPLIFLYLPTGCTHESAIISELDTICFDSQVMPIFQTSCGTSDCHGDGASSEQFRLTNYDEIRAHVVPGEPRESKIYLAITNINSDEFMPPDNPLDETSRNIIQLWITQGANHTTCKTLDPEN